MGRAWVIVGGKASGSSLGLDGVFAYPPDADDARFKLGDRVGIFVAGFTWILELRETS